MPPATEVGLAAVPWGRLLSSVLIVAVLILVLVFGMRVLRGRAMGRQHVLRVVSMLVVGPKERLMLVHVAGKVLLLGVATGGITKLDEFEESMLHVPDDKNAHARGLWRGLKSLKHRWRAS
jgi:flagellar protein FliO/FliZ